MARARPAGAQAGELGLAQRERRAGSAALARGATRVPQPDRLSLPCFLACSSPRRNTQIPSGTDTTPMISIGQMSPHTPLTVVPLRIAERSPRKAYVAGDTFAIHCMNVGSTETG